MSWFTVGAAAVIVVLLLLNAIFVHVLRARRLAPESKAPGLGLQSTLPRNDAAWMLAMLAVLAACWGAPIVAPASLLGQAMASLWVRLSVLAWLVLARVVVAVVAFLLRRRQARTAG